MKKKILTDLFEFGKNSLNYETGLVNWINIDGSKDLSKGTETWIVARMLHSYCLAKLNGIEINNIDEIIIFVENCLANRLNDKDHLGWYSKINENKVLDSSKQSYQAAFVVLAYATYNTLYPNSSIAREKLNNALNIFIDKFYESEYGLFSDSFNIDWIEKEKYHGLNANMHSLEALLASFDVLHTNQLYDICTSIVNFVLSLFNNSEFAQLLPEHFTNTWQPIKEYNVGKKDDQFKPYGATIGHSFEWSRLLLQYAYTFEDKIGKAKFDSIILIAISMFDKAEEFGWDKVNQGYVYTVDFKGNTIISDRMHWVICEAVNTSRALYEITNNPKYNNITLRNENYISKYIIEKDGSWIHQLSKDNKLITTVWNGKPDIYHAVQCSLELSFKHSIAKSSIQKEI